MKKKIYFFIKSIYWSMPSSVRILLNGFRYSLVRYLRSKLLTYSELNVNDVVSEDEFKKLLDGFSEIYIFELAVDWGIDLYQRPQHLATALAAGTNRNCLVIYKTQGDNVNGFKQVEKNVWLTNRLKFIDSLKNVKRVYFSTSIFNQQEHMIAMRSHGKVIYEYIDHISEEISGGKKEIKHLSKIRDFAFEGGVDHVVATADVLFDEACTYLSADRVTLIPNGVNIEHYQQYMKNNIIENIEVKRFVDKYENVVGYFGAIAPWLWYDLIEQVVGSNPNVGFLMIGPDYGGCESLLPNYDNFLWIGPVSYQDLPIVAMKFDVCWIPFRPGKIAKTTSPLKLFEYFAMGKPVIVTSEMMECVKYEEVYHGANISEINQVLLTALQRVNDSDYCRKLKLLAAQNSWSNRALAYHTIHFI